MLESQSISCVIVDTYPNKEFAKLACDQMRKAMPKAQMYVISDENFFEGATFYRINPITSMRSYDSIVLSMIPAIVKEDYTLIFQWDGFIINKDRFLIDYLNYDYIGAPWYHIATPPLVGNGGFSLRSKRLNDFLLRTTLCPDTNILDGFNEDVRLCISHRQRAEDAGLTFAPVALAETFSFEHRFFPSTFGFHGMFNFPLLFDEQFLLDFFDNILARTKGESFWRAFHARASFSGMKKLCLRIQQSLNFKQ